jgi:hypothetical protein
MRSLKLDHFALTEFVGQEKDPTTPKRIASTPFRVTGFPIHYSNQTEHHT